MLVLVLTTAPNFAQSQSHYMASFASAELCNDAAINFKNELEKPASHRVVVEVRAVCAKRRDTK